MLSNLVIFAARALLVLLFLPFSSLDKVLNLNQAVEQAQQVLPVRPLAVILIGGGFAIEVLMSLAVLTGLADRLGALILAAYCVMTAVLWKQFWKSADFRFRGPSKGREIFWDFLKNLAVAGGFLMITFGTTASGLRQFWDAPLSSTHPYSTTAPGEGS